MSVCGLNELPGRLGSVSQVISITDPGYDERPHFRDYCGSVHAFKFNDVWPGAIEDGLPPSAGEVGRLLEIIDAAIREREGLLVHCHAGVSRSTAVTLIALALANPEWSPARCREELLRLRPQALPNPLVLEMAAGLRPELARLLPVEHPVG